MVGRVNGCFDSGGRFSWVLIVCGELDFMKFQIIVGL